MVKENTNIYDMYHDVKVYNEEIEINYDTQRNED